MREIKFRAWDKKNNFMHYNAEQVYDDSATKTKPYLADSFGSVIYRAEEKELELMQFTGLKDKNGKEIYEGDIVKITNEDKENKYDDNGDFDYEDIKKEEFIGQVNYNDSPFCTNVLGFIISNRHKLYDHLLFEKDTEVIGNIYENLELLK